MFIFEKYNKLLSIDGRTERLLQNITSAMRPEKDDPAHIALFKAWVIVESYMGDGIKCIPGRDLKETLDNIIKERESYKNNVLFIDNRRRGQYTTEILSEVAKENTIEFNMTMKADKPALVRVGKNTFYLTDTSTVIILLQYKLFTTNSEKDLTGEMLKVFSPISSLSEENVAAILSYDKITAAYSALKETRDAEVRAVITDYFKSGIILAKDAEIKNAKERLQNILAEYNTALEILRKAEEEKIVAVNSSEGYKKDLERFWSYLSREESSGKILAIENFTTYGEYGFEMIIYFAAMPLIYFDSATMRRVYNNVTGDEKRREYLKKVCDGELFLVAAPMKMRLRAVPINNRIKIEHQFMDAHTLENPHFRYDGRKGCLGTFAPSLSSAASKGDITAYLGLLVQYVQSITPNDGAGNAGMGRLPIMNKEGVIVLNEENEEISQTLEEYWAERV